MGFIQKIILIFFTLLISINCGSTDYGRHLELSLLFYECQRSGPLPKTNRMYWRHDSMVDAGADAGLDLSGGYYDAGDNVKFNFPMACSMTLIAWGGIEFAEGIKKAGQWDYYLDTVKWGTDYFIKCHPSKNTYYAQVGSGQTDHGFWYPPEYMTYKYPSYKVTAGTEVCAETAAAFTAASLLFKSEDSAYSKTLLTHAIDLYDFADSTRGDYTDSVPASGFYSSYSGYNDELAWGALWLYYATNDEQYLSKYKAIADKEYSPQDPKKYPGCDGPISWDDKRPGAYILGAILTKDESRMKTAYDYCDSMVEHKRTPGGLFYDTQLSMWASNRYAANAASVCAVFANHLPESDAKRKSYIDFVKSQIDYMLGNNPAKIDYVVGADKSSPRAVHHRGASGTYDNSATNPAFNVFTLYGALAGGPGASDDFIDSRGNFQMNEVALDYNAAFTLDLAALLHFGLGTPDGKVDFDRSWPPKSPTPDFTINFEGQELSIASGSGLLCSSWCVSFTTKVPIDNYYHSFAVKFEHPNYTFCNIRDSGFLDGKGTEQIVNFVINDKSFEYPTEFEVLCDGYHYGDNDKDARYIPEYGHLYKVKGKGGPENTTPLFENGKC